MNTLFLTSNVYESIRAHGEQTYPHECCGALLGRASEEDWRIVAEARANNAMIGSTHNRYSIAPLELIHIQRRAAQLELQIAGFYHSHPDHPAQVSRTDFEEAHWLGCCYVITAVVQGKADITNAYLLTGATEEEKQFERQTIQILGGVEDTRQES